MNAKLQPNVEATDAHVRVVAVAAAWKVEATALVQGNPYDATSAKGKIWAIGYADGIDGQRDPHAPDTPPYRAGYKAGRERVLA